MAKYLDGKLQNEAIAEAHQAQKNARRASRRKQLVGFAEKVTELASSGKGVEADAGELYAHFRAEQDGAAGAPEQDVRSLQVQASKLRQFIVLGRVCGDEGVELIRRAKAIHAEIYRSSGRERLKLPSTYSALVAVSRAQLAALHQQDMAGGGMRMLTDGEIRKVLSSSLSDLTAAVGAR